jgi:hypothetical protein
VHLDLVERCDQRIHGDDRGAGLDDLLNRGGQRVDGECLNGDEVPSLTNHLIDCGALFGGGKLAVEPTHVDVVQLGPILGRLLTLSAPAHLQTDIGKGSLQRLLRAAGYFAHFGGKRRRDAENPQ